MKDIKSIDHRAAIPELHRYRILRLVWLCLFLPFFAFGQEYGLEFAAKPVTKDKRTQLDLNPGGYYSFRGDFELSFSVLLRDLQVPTFGYIARIVDLEGKSIDIIYNGPESQSLQVVYGISNTPISVPDNAPDIFNNWTDIRLKYDIKNKTLQFDTPDTSVIHQKVDFSGKVKIFFGRNVFKHIKTTDVSRMSIRDIRISQAGKCLHYFPLDEIDGNEANDIITNKKAAVQYPGWISTSYHNWQWSFDTYLHGFAAICFEPDDERVYMVGDEQLKIFSVLKDSIETIEYSSRFSGLISGSQIFYDTSRSRLFAYSLRNKSVHVFNFPDRKWEEISDGPNITIRFWFHNKFYSESDSVLYIFGGYGQHKYNNLVQQYDFKEQRWDTIEASGEVFHPRMYAALGHYADTLYIIGGFGSKAGSQILNPEHYTDLMAFSLKEKKFVKKYEYKAALEDLDFAHSMVINERDHSFYLLGTSKFEYETYLQLLKGNLADPNLISVGDKIPYLFDNEYSYCDLFYSKNSQELIAVNSLTDTENEETKITVHKISYPPLITQTGAEEESTPLQGKKWIILLGLMIFFMVIAMTMFLRRKLNKEKSSSANPLSAKTNGKTKDEKPPHNNKLSDNPEKPANSILFFGGFQVINKHGEDITKKFTPLLKELFLLIILYSIKDKGISVPRLTEILWFSMDAKTAKNNRAVNIAKLKNLLTEIDSCTLSRRTSYWQMEFDDLIVHNDYRTCIKSFHHDKAMSKEDLLQFLRIIKKGPLLGNAGYEWLDEFKLDCSNLIIDHLSHHVDMEEFGSDPELMIKMADAILIFDMMHEDAISIKCKALTTLGKHSLAKEIYAKFAKDYITLYDEPFDRSFTDIIKN
ncbi:MAG: hypothetical protein QNK35_11495 [Bacteroides sp.]|nr:hypothetical protein [Bacteroides sp.]